MKDLLLLGDRQHDIAVWFGVNAGRIAETGSGWRFGWVGGTSSGLPPAGPYPMDRRAVDAKEALEKALVALAEVESAP